SAASTRRPAPRGISPTEATRRHCFSTLSVESEFMARRLWGIVLDNTIAALVLSDILFAIQRDLSNNTPLCSNCGGSHRSISFHCGFSVSHWPSPRVQCDTSTYRRKTMKKMITLLFTLLLATAVASTLAAPASQDGEMAKKKGKSEKAAPPTSDADIQKCIS